MQIVGFPSSTQPTRWYKFIGLDGKVIGMTTYGELSPAEDLYKEFGIKADDVVKALYGLV
ncbi:hypothetical protein ACFPZK_01260 [Psychrobacter urativorans]|uniref:transketolase-like TK C-terminal-containing protein n=1 Tax=Psychrobacter urativorans TaxID=45610 RepID=UPI00360CEA4C